MMFLQRGNSVKSSNMMKKRYATGKTSRKEHFIDRQHTKDMRNVE